MAGRVVVAIVLCLVSAGCHSAAVDATLHNGTSSTVRLIEVDYPSASFGTQVLAPDAAFKYRFKVLGSGDLKLTYTDQSGREIAVKGPALQEGFDGRLRIDIEPDGVRWMPTARSPN